MLSLSPPAATPPAPKNLSLKLPQRGENEMIYFGSLGVLISNKRFAAEDSCKKVIN